MALLETDIEIFINRAQQKIATLGDSMLALDLNNLCIDYDISLIQELSAAVDLFQNSCCDPDENLSYKVIGYLNDKANLAVLPLAIFDNNCLVDAILLPSGGFIEGQKGDKGDAATIIIGTVTPLASGSTPTVNNSGTPNNAVFNFGIPSGLPGTNGTDGTNGWSPIYAVVQDGLRYVLELTGWTGGTGTAPTTVGVYIGSSGYVSDIASAVDIRGLQGIAGLDGNNGFDGWTPVLSIILDGQRTVLQVLSWIGGSGTPPASGVYVSSTGFTTDITAAMDIRGAQGIKGDPFNINASGLLSGRNTYDNSGAGFTYLATDTGDVYIKNSPLPGDWGPPVSFVGDRGWSPVLNTTIDGTRVVLQVSDWAGGGGPKPPAGSYIGQTGFTNNVSDATNIRGDKGEFFIDAQGPLSDRNTYDSQDRQFIYYANDNGKIYLKNSNTPADWTIGYDFRGERGPIGPVGSTGPSGSALTDYDSSRVYGSTETTLNAGILYLRTGGGTTTGAFNPAKWTQQIISATAYSTGSGVGILLSPTTANVYGAIDNILNGTLPYTGNHEAAGNSIQNLKSIGIGCVPNALRAIDVEVSGNCLAYLKSTSGNDVSLLMYSSGSFVGGFAYDSGAGFTSFYGPGAGNSAVDIDGSLNVKVRHSLNVVDLFGAFGAAPVAQQSGGSATAGSSYTATEQAMLQKAYNALRTFGFLS